MFYLGIITGIAISILVVITQIYLHKNNKSLEMVYNAVDKALSKKAYVVGNEQEKESRIRELFDLKHE